MHDVSAHIPFGSGPRICPGRNLALLEMKLLLSMLYKNFEVERVGEAEDVREVFAIAMSPAGLKVRLRRRSADTVLSAKIRKGDASLVLLQYPDDLYF